MVMVMVMVMMMMFYFVSSANQNFRVCQLLNGEASTISHDDIIVRLGFHLLAGIFKFLFSPLFNCPQWRISCWRTCRHQEVRRTSNNLLRNNSSSGMHHRHHRQARMCRLHFHRRSVAIYLNAQEARSLSRADVYHSGAIVRSHRQFVIPYPRLIAGRRKDFVRVSSRRTGG